MFLDWPRNHSPKFFYLVSLVKFLEVDQTKNFSTPPHIGNAHIEKVENISLSRYFENLNTVFHKYIVCVHIYRLKTSGYFSSE